MRGLGEESGSVVVFVAFSLTCLLGFLALSTDVGTLFSTRRNRQTSAEFALMPSAPLIVAVDKLEFGGIVNAAIEATNTARAGGTYGVESLLATSPIRCIAKYPLGCINHYSSASYSLLGRAIMGESGHHEGSS